VTVSGRLFGRFAGTYPLAETYHREALGSEMEQVTERASALVVEATNLNLTGHPETAVIDRAQWIDRNVSTFAHLTEPAVRQLETRLEERGASRGAIALAGHLVQAETAAILSVLAKRVLGQYELVLPTGGSADTVTYVGPNILQIERTRQFRPSDFRFWVALHELTHRAQFRGVPWMRDYFMGLVTELVESARPEAGKLGRVLEELGSRRAEGKPLIDQRGLFGLFATPEQTEIVDKVQALMSLLEGHGHVVMDRLGADHIKSQARMSRILKERRQDRRTAAFFRLTGLEMKLRQYRLGEQFVLGVEREAGWDAVSLAFRGVSSLPTLDEIEDPARWLARVG
jgi:coenzyme F420 biosynthesis associated uncharacterized protein